jgi:L-asparaginase / beta-aspartyl-peptidase
MQSRSGVVFVHGGVSGTKKDHHPMAEAVRAGMAAATALDAAEAAVVVLEDDPALNAAYGACLTRDGRIELDAGIADGATNRSGGTTNVQVKNPVVLARAVMEQTPHALLAGEGAAAFAGEIGLPPLDETTLEQRERYERARRDGRLGLDNYGAPEYVDTVGAVALDGRGRLAAASSTGGVFGKMPGRVGDAPVFGAGYYASTTIAVVGTGVGEEFLRSLACYRVAQRVELGDTPQVACERVIEELARRGAGTTAGLLAVDAEGRSGAAYRGASWAVEGPSGPIEAAPVT